MNAPLPLETALSLYDGVRCTDSGQYFCNERQFALPVMGNSVERLDCGERVYRHILHAMNTASRFIWIADWQMAFDVELAQRGDPEHPARLAKVIEDIIKSRPVQIRVLLYRSPHDSAPGTYDGLVADKINAINRKEYPGKVIVLTQGPTSAQADSIDYSHHQKFVVVDGRIGFIGGIDLTHGRFETPEFDVVIDPSRYVLNEARNPCVSNLRGMTPAEHDLVHLGFAKPYGGGLLDYAGGLLEEGCQPRMPWQDVHIKITGPAVVDIHRNFVRRWNAMLRMQQASRGRLHAAASPRRETAQRPSEIDTAWLAAHGATELLQAAQTAKVGGAMVQIVRSVSSRHLKLESYRHQQFSPPDDLLLHADPSKRKVYSDCLQGWKDEHQSNILNAMVNCIRSADNYVYIETQFFISDFGTVMQYRKVKNGDKDADRMAYVPVADSRQIGNENDGIRNTILDALAERIEQHIIAKTPFHVYLVVPVHPEGSIADGSVWKQQWLALASICRGSRSLVGRVQEALKKRGRKPQEWKQYLTVLNMRNYGVAVQYARDPKNFREDFTREIGRYVITEQIYIHSKLLIVDDAVAIVGSANINDRSLTGNGDTEIAAVVVDTEDVRLEDLGSPQFKVATRKFARELRRSLWGKHFGFALDQDKYFPSVKRNPPEIPNKAPPEHPPREKMTAERFLEATRTVTWDKVMNKPCHPDTVRVIQKIADDNREAYEKVFKHTPRNGMKGFEDVLCHFTRAYASVSNSLFTNAESEAASQRERQKQLLSQQTMLSERAREKTKQGLDEAYAMTLNSLKDTLGVVPPALQDSYMTTQLMPHQQEGWQLPVTDVRRRYITFDGDRVHDVKKAVEHLRKTVVGFFVSAPLNWGEGMEIDGDVSKHMTIDIALDNEPDSPSSMS